MNATDSQRLAIFGGSFDPVHGGHLAMAESAVRECGIDRVVFVPCRQSPHKAGPTGAGGDERHAMLQLAVEPFPWATADRYELEKGGPSYSWETAQHFRNNTPGSTGLFWILGGDQWEALDRWSHPERLADTLEFIVFSRGGRPLEAREGFRAVFLPFTHPASATVIREHLAEGSPVPEGWLEPNVSEYIRKNGLYRLEK